MKEEDLLEEPLDGWSETGKLEEGCEGEGSGDIGREGMREESLKAARGRETIHYDKERPRDNLCEEWPGQKMI